MSHEGRPVLRALWFGTVPYLDALALQRDLAEARAGGSLAEDSVLLLEHPPTYTFGRNTEAEHVPGGAERLRGLGAECHEVDRGGSVTFHGPGQLVAYPIVLLAGAFPIRGHEAHGDVILYLRALEEALIATCAGFGASAARRPPYTGAWVGEDKVAAIGVRLARGVTTHGVALNVAPDLSWFHQVVPCGITDGGVTSLEQLGAGGLTAEAVGPVLARELARVFQQRLELSGLARDVALAPAPAVTRRSGRPVRSARD